MPGRERPTLSNRPLRLGVRMTSEDSTPRRRPPTIDLTATEVETGNADQAGAGEAAGTRFARRFAGLRPQTAHLVGAAAGVIAMLAAFFGLWIGGLLPPRDGRPAPAPSPAAAISKEISARLDKMEAALAAQRSDETLAPRLAAVQAETKSLDNSLAALNRHLDDIAVTARSAAATADAAKSAAQSGAEPASIDALTSRVAALESTVKMLSSDLAGRSQSADDAAARLTVAAEALRAAVERGAPYAAELNAVKSLGVENTALAPLEPFAADGLPSATALARELAVLTPELLRAAGKPPSENSFLGQLEANAQKLVRVTPVNAPPGDDLSAVVARLDVDAARADIAGAIGEIAKLPDASRSLAQPWIAKAQAREAAITASRRIAADALAALSKPASQ
jgi:hypothetical protein